MNKQIETIKKTRIYLLDIVKDLTVDELNETPAGYNNNIIWNLAHMTAAQQGICYKRAGIQPVLEEKYIAPYLPGTKPGEPVDSSEIEVIKGLMLSSLDLLQRDYDDNVFSDYTPWTSRYGVLLSNIDEALEFLPFHEGYHSGFITALKRLVHK